MSKETFEDLIVQVSRLANNYANMLEKSAVIMSDQQKKIDELKDIIEGYSDKGFWGRTAARLESENKELREAFDHLITFNERWFRGDIERDDTVFRGATRQARQTLAKCSEKGEE